MEKVDRKYVEELIKKRDEKGLNERIVIEGLNMYGENLENMELADIEFRHCDLKFVSFDKSALSNCEFNMCNMYNAYFKESNLYNVSMIECNLEYAFFGESYINNWHISDCCMYASKFMKSDIVSSRMIECKIKASNFENSEISFLTIQGCYAKRTSFREAHIRDCNFSDNTFENSSFVLATMSKTNFNNSNLSHSRLDKAVFTGCLLDYVDFYASDITSLTEFVDCRVGLKTRGLRLACPAVGEFIGWKKVIIDVEKKISGDKDMIEYKHVKTTGIVQLLIPEDALRSSATTEKCRANKAKVIGLEVSDPKAINWVPMEEWDVHSDFDRTFKYHIGDDLVVPNFDRNRWNECAPGIHFFMNKEDAENY